ncbi:MAG: 6-carboxytetrahydropterin synthase [Sphingobacteriia bacterium]|nr:6-carboxytetrahydropterin synthase [Sphingobacteriia bacterium]
MEKSLMIFAYKTKFSCSYKMTNPNLSEQENLMFYGLNNNILGNSFELIIEFKGAIDPVNGMVLNHLKLNEFVKEFVINKVNNKFLNEEVDEFHHIVPTLENLAFTFWNWLLVKINEKVLHSIKIIDSNGNYAMYKGEKLGTDDALDFVL